MGISAQSLECQGRSSAQWGMAKHAETYQGRLVQISTQLGRRGQWIWSYEVEGGLYGALRDPGVASEPLAKAEALAYAQAVIDRGAELARSGQAAKSGG